MSSQRYKTKGDRAHLSKRQWKKFIAFIATELQKPRNAVGLSGRKSDEEEWGLWFNQFFCNDLEGRFWISPDQSRQALENHREEIFRFVRSRCLDTARKIRNAKQAKRDQTKKGNRLHVPAKNPSHPEPEDSPFKTSDFREEHSNGKGPGDRIAAVESNGHTFLHRLTTGGDTQIGYLFSSLDRLDVFASAIPVDKQQSPDGRVSPMLDRQSPKGSDNYSSSTPGSSVELVKEGHREATPQQSDPLSSNRLLKTRSLRKNHATPATARTRKLYAWAVKVHGPLRRSNPTREIVYRNAIPSLHRFLHGIMTARNLPSRFFVRALVVSTAGDAFRVKVNSTQEKLDWNFIASRFFEIGVLVDIDVWVA